MNIQLKKTVAALGGAMLAGVIGTAAAHDIDEAGEPVCTEANYMMADAQNQPFASNAGTLSGDGAGRVIEMNIITGTPGITVSNPFHPDNMADPDICPPGIACFINPPAWAPDGPFGENQGPWKPTGVLSGGENGHAFITSAGQQALTQFHRDGTPIRTLSYKPITGNPAGGPGFGSLPRPLGTQLMPNGNLIQAICDANFFNANNSDPFGAGESAVDPATGDPRPNNSSWMYFPPVYATDARQDNSRFLVIDQVTMKVIDEYSRPQEGEPGHELWGCPAGIMFSDEGMYVSTFHGGAVLEIDWKAGVDDKTGGVGINDPDAADDFEIGGDDDNRAVVTNVIDFRLGEPLNNSGERRDSLRAISFDESGNIYATDRVRSRECVRGEAPGATPFVGPPPCNPSVFRQRVNIASFDDYNNSALRRTIGLDPGVNVIAGIRTNRMSGPGCDYVMANKAIYSTDEIATGYAPTEDLCDVETLLVASSAMNPGCDANNDGFMGPGHAANPCFKPGGGVAEYIIHPNFTDGGAAYGGATCTGTPGVTGVDTMASTGNAGCAQPIARFRYTDPDSTNPADEINVDPRMLMIIHEAFGQ